MKFSGRGKKRDGVVLVLYQEFGRVSPFVSFIAIQYGFSDGEEPFTALRCRCGDVSIDGYLRVWLRQGSK